MHTLDLIVKEWATVPFVKKMVDETRTVVRFVVRRALVRERVNALCEERKVKRVVLFRKTRYCGAFLMMRRVGDGRG